MRQAAERGVTYLLSLDLARDQRPAHVDVPSHWLRFGFPLGYGSDLLEALLKNITELQPLKERISIKFNLDPLGIDDTLRYVVFRLKCAGANRGIFSREAIDHIYEFSGGIPLRINNLCDRCLLIGLMRKADIIDSKTVEDAIEDLGS